MKWPTCCRSWKTCTRCTRRWWQQRKRRGAIDFETPEVKFRLDQTGSVESMGATERNDAHKLIEECMIAANVQAALFLEKKKIPRCSARMSRRRQRSTKICSSSCASSSSACRRWRSHAWRLLRRCCAWCTIAPSAS
jgi:hypothetical protein